MRFHLKWFLFSFWFSWNFRLSEFWMSVADRLHNSKHFWSFSIDQAKYHNARLIQINNWLDQLGREEYGEDWQDYE